MFYLINKSENIPSVNIKREKKITRWLLLKINKLVKIKKPPLIGTKLFDTKDLCFNSFLSTKKFFLVNPSELDEYWFKNRKNIFYDKKIKLLYVGRIRIEKGIFNFLNLFKKLDNRFQLTIIGDRYDSHFNIKNIFFKNFFSNAKHLIKQYDKHHILLLPSYTESHPKVVYEALSRLRPVLIFDDIKHIIRDMNGIFVSKRNLKNFLKTLFMH